MFVCLCHGISDRSIREIIRSGASNIRSLQKKCKAGGRCGTCLYELKAIIREEQQTSVEHYGADDVFDRASGD